MNLQNDLLGLKSKLMNIEKEFTEKIVVQTEKESLDKRIDEKINDLVENNKTSMVNLNIGGQIYHTKLSTLLTHKKSLFYKTLSQYENNISKIPSEIFFDRPYDHFDVILNFLRTNRISLKGVNSYDKEDIKEELQFYGLSKIDVLKHNEIEIDWDPILSKAGAFTINKSLKGEILIHSTTCYSHFITNKTFTNEDFQSELEVAVSQSCNYLYVGICNQDYSLTANCGCCNPNNCNFIQNDGTIHINSTKTNNGQLAWGSDKIIIGMKVFLSQPNKEMYFYFPEKNNLELGQFSLTGSSWKIYAGHCNKGNGKIKILDCFAI